MSTFDNKAFEVIDEICERNFNKVYLVKNSKTNEYYAIKVFNINSDQETSRNSNLNNKDDPEVLSIFREANLMSLLNHPCVLKFVGCYPNFNEISLPTIITEFAANYSLKDIIHLESNGRSPNEWTNTKKLISILGIATGMSYLHSQNIFHGNLKPSNILIDEYLHPKIGDFGLLNMKLLFLNNCSVEYMNSQSESTTNDIPYMAPEILEFNVYSELSDVYAFGSIVYEILTCETPFKKCKKYRLTKYISEGFRPIIEDDIPNAYRELIERCWAQEPEKRPQFNEIVEELRTNSKFITESIDDAEYHDYIEFIDNYISTFNSSKEIVHFSDFIKEHGRNKNITPTSFNPQMI